MQNASMHDARPRVRPNDGGSWLCPTDVRGVTDYQRKSERLYVKVSFETKANGLELALTVNSDAMR